MSEIQHLKDLLYGKKKHPLLFGFKMNASGSRGQVSWRNGSYSRYKNSHESEADSIEENAEGFTDWDDKNNKTGGQKV